MLQTDLLSYIKLIKYLETDGFKFDSYVDNRIIEGNPLPKVFHVYDVKASHW